MITATNGNYEYYTTQSSTDSTVDMYWLMVNRRLINIYNKVRYAYCVDWIDGCITDCTHAIRHCQYINDVRMRINYIQSFERIIKLLTSIKESINSGL